MTTPTLTDDELKTLLEQVSSPMLSRLLADLAAAREEVEKLRDENERWNEMLQDELKETLRLIDALGVRTEVDSGVACMDAMLTKIKQLRDDARVLAEEVKSARAYSDAIGFDTEWECKKAFDWSYEATDASGALSRHRSEA